MKRLKAKLLAMEPDTATYTEMYNGSIDIVPPHGAPYGDCDPTYYSGEIGYFISGTHKLAQDKPTVELFLMQFDPTKLAEALSHAEKQAAVRAWLKTSEYCAFVANGSILPRTKETDLPLREAIPFQSPPADEICDLRGYLRSRSRGWAGAVRDR